MIKRTRWLIPAVCLAVGLYVLRLSYLTHAKWHENLAIGDLSMAEAYEMEFWPIVSISLTLIMLSSFLVGRWSVSRQATD